MPTRPAGPRVQGDNVGVLRLLTPGLLGTVCCFAAPLAGAPVVRREGDGLQEIRHGIQEGRGTHAVDGLQVHRAFSQTRDHGPEEAVRGGGDPR